MNSTRKILLVDDHVLVRAGLRILIEKILTLKMPDLTIVGEASDGAEAIELAKKLRPDLVLMDITMPGINGLEAAARLTKEVPEAKVIILSMHTGEDYVLQALRAGASGYLLKDSATSELDMALQAVSRGDTYLSPAISKYLIEHYLGRSGGKAPARAPVPASIAAPVAPPAAPPHAPDPLTPRQREILQLIADGKSTKEIAFLLNLSGKTVETHRAQLMDRLGIHDVAGLVRYAMRSGLIAPEV